ncbi:hypothetical protein L1887_56051 [Cichorium endivia]|nr:hypothetical protein L1887_56051 [Cichorium endivia]
MVVGCLLGGKGSRWVHRADRFIPRVWGNSHSRGRSDERGQQACKRGRQCSAPPTRLGSQRATGYLGEFHARLRRLSWVDLIVCFVRLNRAQGSRVWLYRTLVGPCDLRWVLLRAGVTLPTPIDWLFEGAHNSASFFPDMRWNGSWSQIRCTGAVHKSDDHPSNLAPIPRRSPRRRIHQAQRHLSTSHVTQT